MKDQIITCPRCRAEIPLSEALRHEIEEQVLTAERQKHQEELAEKQKVLEARLKKDWEEKKALEARTKKSKVRSKNRNQAAIGFTS